MGTQQQQRFAKEDIYDTPGGRVEPDPGSVFWWMFRCRRDNFLRFSIREDQRRVVWNVFLVHTICMACRFWKASTTSRAELTGTGTVVLWRHYGFLQRLLDRDCVAHGVPAATFSDLSWHFDHIPWKVFKVFFLVTSCWFCFFLNGCLRCCPVIWKFLNILCVFSSVNIRWV